MKYVQRRTYDVGLKILHISVDFDQTSQSGSQYSTLFLGLAYYNVAKLLSRLILNPHSGPGFFGLDRIIGATGSAHVLGTARSDDAVVADVNGEDVRSGYFEHRLQ
jgi:hypothetical protein